MRRRRREKMPDRFHGLAEYNSEVARGLVHTPEWRERMAVLQADFDAWAADVFEREIVGR